MKAWFGLFMLCALAACAAPANQGTPAASATAPGRADYPDLGAAPELSGDVWLNTPAPLRLRDLRGKVVLLDMWTFG